jgi:hypothetical protein
MPFCAPPGCEDDQGNISGRWSSFTQRSMLNEVTQAWCHCIEHATGAKREKGIAKGKGVATEVMDFVYFC